MGTELRPDKAGPIQDAVHGKFRPDIEGLRAVAVLAVVLFHADLPGLPGGFIGVDVFFVISGFLITGLLWREFTSSGTVSMRSFYGARARRLLPASATVGVVTMIASALVLPPLQVKSVMLDGIFSALYVSNYWFIASGVNYFGNRLASPFQHYWSLGVEEQFYLFWPFLILGTAWILRRTRHVSRAEASAFKRPYLWVLVAVAALSFGLSIFTTFVVPPVAFFSLPTRAWQLAAGGLVALTAANWQRLSRTAASIVGWTGLALILVTCIQLHHTTPYPGIAAIAPTLGTVLVIGAGCALPTQGAGRVLCLAPMAAIGRVSYSWYLWHWPLVILVPVFMGQPMGVPFKLALMIIAYGLAILTQRFIENPLRFADRIRNSAKASLGLGGVATVIAVCVGLVIWTATPDPVGPGPAAAPMVITVPPVPPPGSPIAEYDAAVRDVFDQVQAAVAASAGMQVVPLNLTPPLTSQTDQMKAMLKTGCLLLPMQDTPPECIAGDTASATTVALIGDSRAAMLIPAFEDIATQRHWRLQMLAKAACPITELPVAGPWINPFAEQFQRCAVWRGHVMERLRADPPQLVVISSARGYGAGGFGLFNPDFKAYDDAWIATLKVLVEQLRGLGSTVLMIGPNQDPPTPSTPTCLSAHLRDVTVCSAKRDTTPDPGVAAEREAVLAAGGQWADVTELFCTANICPVIVGNTMVYYDAHITDEYARQIAPALGALADRALAAP